MTESLPASASHCIRINEVRKTREIGTPDCDSIKGAFRETGLRGAGKHRRAKFGHHVIGDPSARCLTSAALAVHPPGRIPDAGERELRGPQRAWRVLSSGRSGAVDSRGRYALSCSISEPPHFARSHQFFHSDFARTAFSTDSGLATHYRFASNAPTKRELRGPAFFCSMSLTPSGSGSGRSSQLRRSSSSAASSRERRDDFVRRPDTGNPRVRFAERGPESEPRETK